MKTRKPQYWTMWNYGFSGEWVCSKHKTLSAAQKAADKCEERGGAPHRILEVVEVVPYPRKKKEKC
jgi:hypothetical protein